MNYAKENMFLEIRLDNTSSTAVKTIFEFAKEAKEHGAKIIFDNVKFDKVDLASLVDLQPSYLKISVHEIEKNKEKSNFKNLLSLMQNSLRIKTIATFVENENDLITVQKANIKYAQGYFFKKEGIANVELY